METEKQITGALDDLGDALRRQPSVRDEVMRRVTQHAATGGAPKPARWAGRRMLARFAALAACAAVTLLVWSPWGRNGGLGAQQAFAAAIAQVESAGTFACRQIVTQVVDGKEEVREWVFMFKEPDLERIENRQGMPPEMMVTDYAKQLRLIVRPEDKIAELQDISTMYAVDEESGELKPSELGTHARDSVLRISAQVVNDLGIGELDGRPVWVLQSAGEAEPVKTVYVDPESGKPVRIELSWPSSQQSYTYADIEIDTELDDALFTLDPPAGYALQDGRDGVKHVDEMNGKMLTKMKYLVMACYEHAPKNGEFWPRKLEDLTAAGMDAQKLKTLLAAPDDPDGEPVILYRQPRPGEKDAIVVYEAPAIRRRGKVVCGFMDGHSEVMTQEQFDEAMK